MTLPAIDTHVYVKYGRGKQPGHIVAHTRTGKIKVRGLKHGWKWCDNLRIVDPADIVGPAPDPKYPPPRIES
jgi:hypothetical protein